MNKMKESSENEEEIQYLEKLEKTYTYTNTLERIS